MAEKIYTPEVIQENPFPGDPLLPGIPQPKAPAGTYAPAVTKEKSFPRERVAHELIGSALNTKSKKILQEFQFTPSGAIQVGDYKKGISGDLRITPNGLTARDLAGLTTFAIDGTTGGATFKGQIQTGSVMVAGEIVDEFGETIIDSEGLISTKNFQFGQTGSYNQSITNITSETVGDVSDMVISDFTLSRPTMAFVYMTAKAHISAGGGSGIIYASLGTSGLVQVSIIVPNGISVLQTFATCNLVELSAGTHTIKAQAEITAAGTTMGIQDRQISYILFGR